MKNRRSGSFATHIWLRGPTQPKSAHTDIENHIKPLIGSRRVSKIVRTDIDLLLLRDIAAGKPRQSQKTGHRGLSRVRGG